jgi:hypothetical protein
MTVVLIGTAVAAGAAYLLYLHRKAQNPDVVLSALNQLASENHMSPDTTFVWRNRGMAINKALGKLLYVENSGGKETVQIVDITDLKACEIVKRYSQSAGLPGGRTKKHLASIDLELLVKQNGPGGCIMSFYNEKYDKVSDMKMLFQKAWHWKRMLLR